LAHPVYISIYIGIGSTNIWIYIYPYICAAFRPIGLTPEILTHNSRESPETYYENYSVYYYRLNALSSSCVVIVVLEVTFS